MQLGVRDGSKIAFLGLHNMLMVLYCFDVIPSMKLVRPPFWLIQLGFFCAVDWCWPKIIKRFNVFERNGILFFLTYGSELGRHFVLMIKSDLKFWKFHKFRFEIN